MKKLIQNWNIVTYFTLEKILEKNNDNISKKEFTDL